MFYLRDFLEAEENKKARIRLTNPGLFTDDRDRTDTRLLSADFESTASTNSATSASKKIVSDWKS